MRAKLEEIVVDCHDPALLVRFWADMLGGEPVDREPDWSYVDPPEMIRLAFQRVPESKVAKNRLHLDLHVEDIESAAREVEGRGAVRNGDIVTDTYGRFLVMHDPEGNEFCFVSD